MPKLGLELEQSIVGRDGWVHVNAEKMYYRELNQLVRKLVAEGYRKIEINNASGQRYIGTNLHGLDTHDLVIRINGTPGNDLASFLNGARIEVMGNAQDGCGNTMNEGELIIHGRAGDILGHSMRGGKIFVRGSVGYRAAIHMKEYEDKKPVVVIGCTCQDFFSEYMAGGTVILLGLSLQDGERHQANLIGTGMHGGTIYVRGHIEPAQTGKEVGIVEPDEADRAVIGQYVGEFARHFGMDARQILKAPFVKLYPKSLRPYGRLYAY